MLVSMAPRADAKPKTWPDGRYQYRYIPVNACGGNVVLTYNVAYEEPKVLNFRDIKKLVEDEDNSVRVFFKDESDTIQFKNKHDCDEFLSYCDKPWFDVERRPSKRRLASTEHPRSPGEEVLHRYHMTNPR